MPYGNMTGGEDFVLGQRSAFGKNIAKEFKGSDQGKRQAALSSFMFEQGANYRKQEKALNEAFESGSRLNNLMSGPYVPKATGGIRKGYKQPTGGSTISEMAGMAKDTPTFFNTLLAGSLAQGPVKALGRVAEEFTGDETTGNRWSKSVLDELTAPSDARFGMAKAGLVNMTAEERRVAGNKFYADQLKSNEEKALAKEMLAPEFTSDATYGDFIDTASWFSPGSFLKGLKAAGKAGSVGAKAFGAAPRQARLAGGLAAGAGAYAGYNELKPEEADAASFESIMNLTKSARVGGRTRTELDRIVKQINKTTSKRYGSGKGLGKDEIEEFILSYLYNPMNRGYIDRVGAGESVPGGKSAFLVGAHETGKTPELGGGRNPTSMQSGKLNRLEMDMRRAGGNPKNSMDVLYWAMENNKKYAGMSINDMIVELGT